MAKGATLPKAIIASRKKQQTSRIGATAKIGESGRGVLSKAK